MSQITIIIVAEKDGIKAERTYRFDNVDMGRIIWAYDSCFNCDGDPDAIIDALARGMIMRAIDHTHEYEMTMPRNPIQPKIE